MPLPRPAAALQIFQAIGGKSETWPYAVAGVRVGAAWMVGATRVRPNLDVAWRHVFDSVTPAATLAFAATPTASWTVAGTPIGRNSLIISAGFDADLDQALAATLYYHGELASGADRQAIEGGFKLKF